MADYVALLPAPSLPSRCRVLGVSVTRAVLKPGALCGHFVMHSARIQNRTGLPYRASDARRLLHKKLRGLQHAARNIILPEPYGSVQATVPDR